MVKLILEHLEGLYLLKIVIGLSDKQHRKNQFYKCARKMLRRDEDLLNMCIRDNTDKLKTNCEFGEHHDKKLIVQNGYGKCGKH